jgi:hypothetical protein
VAPWAPDIVGEKGGRGALAAEVIGLTAVENRVWDKMSNAILT